MNYHAHIYFKPEQKMIADEFRKLILENLSLLLHHVSPLYLGPLGPHPIPTFEIHFKSEYLDSVQEFLKLHRSGLSVLIHEDTGDDVQDHSENILWLGVPVNLDFEFFEKIKTHPELRINK